jgi:glycerol-3-phosphate dehydrogenase
MAELDNTPLIEKGMVLRAEVIWAVRQEGASSLQDVLYRRTGAVFYCPDELPAIIEPVSRLMTAELGWSEKMRITEVERMRNRFRCDSDFSEYA